MKSKNKVLVICGRKNSGKTLLSNYITGYILRQNKIIENFGLTTEGQLVVNSYWVDEHGATVEGEGILDLNQRSAEHLKFYIESVWPYVKTYSFKGYLSDVLKQIFPVESGKKTPYVWSDLFRFLPPMEVKELKDLEKHSKKISYDNFIEILDYEVFRVIDNKYIVNSLIKQIKDEYPSLSIIVDCKTQSDLECIKDSFETVKTVWIESEKSKKESNKIEKNIENLSNYEFDLKICTDNATSVLYHSMIEWKYFNEYHKEQKSHEYTANIYREA